MNFRRWWEDRKLRFEVNTGLRTWGRQPDQPGKTQLAPSGAVAVTVPYIATMTARVIRADGTIEELGVLAEAEVQLTPEDVAALENLARE